MSPEPEIVKVPESSNVHVISSPHVPDAMLSAKTIWFGEKDSIKIIVRKRDNALTFVLCI